MDLLNSVSQIMFKFTEYVMYFAPLGIFGAIASTVGMNGLSILKNYAKIIFHYIQLLQYLFCWYYLLPANMQEFRSEVC